MNNRENTFNIVLAGSAFLFVCNVFIWNSILFPAFGKNPEIYFFDVGQGDSQLIVLPGLNGGRPVKILSDGGPSGKILGELSKILPPEDRYIDIVLLSHPQLDHFGGLIEVLERYQIGAFIYNGRDGTAAAWEDLKNVLKKKNIQTVILAGGDALVYGEDKLDILSPDAEFLKSKELNDTSLVGFLKTKHVSALFVADIGENVEEYLRNKYDIDVDILKAGHHGSRFSSSASFLKEVSPKVAVIQVGKNRYGHPTKEALSRLSQSGAKIYRNDRDGLVRLTLGDGYVDIEKEK